MAVVPHSIFFKKHLGVDGQEKWEQRENLSSVQHFCSYFCYSIDCFVTEPYANIAPRVLTVQHNDQVLQPRYSNHIVQIGKLR